LYNASEINTWVTRSLSLMSVPPFSVIRDGSLYFQTDASNEVAQKISLDCKKKYSQSKWSQVNCVSNAISTYIKEIDWSEEDDDFFTNNTPCRLAVVLFQKSIDLLHIKNVFTSWSHITYSKSWKKEPLLHFVSMILVRANGFVYSYALDVIEAPNTLFPASRAAIVHHSPQLNNVSEVQTLPLEL
ncbi:MAG TPA: hypothetical protein PLJ21_07750, partial [Pseudobdellovibrionaceae bacterium]|nr:hypothetical protein [Pseudobdellovibrionaceae bacterium]